uniref:Uncharacterized protein n=1 Tax=Cucumis melo TaxID=3656 RepID=A0A9I9DGF3_CUCME
MASGVRGASNATSDSSGIASGVKGEAISNSLGMASGVKTASDVFMLRREFPYKKDASVL